MKKTLEKLGLFLAIAFTFSFLSIAHPGRTDSYGGHYVRKSGWGHPVGSYHYHSGPYAGYTVNSKGEVPQAFKEKTTASSSSISTLKIQERLTKLGYNCGKPDGKMGAKTKQAIKAFQRDNGLKVDGVVGIQTRKALGQ